MGSAVAAAATVVAAAATVMAVAHNAFGCGVRGGNGGMYIKTNCYVVLLIKKKILFCLI